ncbi:hypothetical protein KAFR_0A03670 [Kazachstania africana CBS 2517]|uniref:F-box domain-containing protein n=1 Tax=Kazachstania africana (strain ATCC 22294 / BCRC 22015 / CBS 2517 / CECT 1963 / NBRC 1671 / NRRL Y-8276) TaxID=1071382 RepID=H2AN52_KAZAF|nr:hypothetical protein KAFR_0A03670 [Kazachstania africana CBS 2517]CCF55802.1 hypothetical protein KAFR_0A03670 [Kazachstania africana CBS 2517]
MSKRDNFSSELPPDVVEATLPFLSPEDIKNLSLTNKYYKKLLDYDSSRTLWHDLYHKDFGTIYTNTEPFQSENHQKFKTCSETIMVERYPYMDWQQIYQARTDKANFYTWGCLRHSRLGYTAASNTNLTDGALNGGARLSSGVNCPTRVPWFPSNAPADDRPIVQISSGGFSFQILTKSGKIFTTGSTYTGGHKGPGPRGAANDYNPFRDAIRALERGYPRISGRGPVTEFHPISTTGTFPRTMPLHHGPTPVPAPTGRLSSPHSNIYKDLEQLGESANEYVPGNKHIRRMLTRNSFPIYCDPNDLHIEKSKFGKLKFVAISSGRSHFLALDDKNDIYSWDNSESEHGVKIIFDNLPSKISNPILKIACGWDFDSVYIFGIGLVLWEDREALQKGMEASHAYHEIIPNTGEVSGDDKLVDFTCTQGKTVYYITNAADTLYQYSSGTIRKIKLPIDGKISKVTSCFTSLVVFVENDCYSIQLKEGNLDIDSIMKLVLEDPDDFIISLSGGDYHTLALTKKGQLYVWGVESQYSGCFGIGRPEHIVNELHVGSWNGSRNVKVSKPLKITLDQDYSCVAIAAGGWQCGALIIKND